MPEIMLQYDDSDFAEVVKRKTHNLKDNQLFYYTIFEKATLSLEIVDDIFYALKSELKLVSNKNDRTIFISELLLHLEEVRQTFISEFDSEQRAMDLLNDIVHYLFRELEKLKIGADRNAFSGQEIKELTSKINLIIKRIDTLRTGQEVIFDRIEELKEDYRDILNSFGLGKKPFLQRFAGIFASYVGEKGADEAFDALKPLIRDILNQSTKLIEH